MKYVVDKHKEWFKPLSRKTAGLVFVGAFERRSIIPIQADPVLQHPSARLDLDFVK